MTYDPSLRVRRDFFLAAAFLWMTPFRAARSSAAMAAISDSLFSGAFRLSVLNSVRTAWFHSLRLAS